MNSTIFYVQTSSLAPKPQKTIALDPEPLILILNPNLLEGLRV